VYFADRDKAHADLAQAFSQCGESKVVAVKRSLLKKNSVGGSDLQNRTKKDEPLPSVPPVRTNHSPWNRFVAPKPIIISEGICGNIGIRSLRSAAPTRQPLAGFSSGDEGFYSL
jgi:hypothetical protein